MRHSTGVPPAAATRIEVIRFLVFDALTLRDTMVIAFGGSMTAMAFCAAAAIRSMRLTYGRVRAGWVLGALHGLLMLTVGIGSLLAGRSAAGARVFSTISLVAIVLQVAQLALLLPPAATVWAKLARLADIIAVTAALGGLAWQFIEPVMDRLPRLVLASLIGYETLVIAGAAWALVSVADTDPRKYGRVPHLLGVALAVEALFGLMNLRYFFGAPAWVGLLGAGLPIFSALLVGAAGMETGRVHRRRGRTASRPQSYRGLVVPYLPVVFSFVTVVVVLAVAGTSDALLVWVLVVTTAMAIVRQFLSLVFIAGLASRLERQAHEDSLTGLPNRAAFHARGAEVLANARPDELTAVLLIDLDGFKQVNDLLGHAAGDRLLVAAGQVLTTLVGQRGMAARLGGDEFVVLVPRLLAPTEAEVIAGAAVARLGALGRTAGIDLPVGGSVGVGLARGPGHETAALLGRADAALYAAKAAGKNTYRRHADLAAAT